MFQFNIIFSVCRSLHEGDNHLKEKMRSSIHPLLTFEIFAYQLIPISYLRYLLLTSAFSVNERFVQPLRFSAVFMDF